MHHHLRRLVVASSLLPPCLVATAQSPGVTPTLAAPLTAQNQQALIIQDPTVLAAFPLSKTIGQIISTRQGAAADTAVNREFFLKSMLNSFAVSSFINPSNSLPETVSPRLNEAALNPTAMLDPNNTVDGFSPAAIHMNFHLMPSNGLNCGEYRITYTKNSGIGTSFDRMTMIFEGALPNPAPLVSGKRALSGCLPVAKFMADLTKQTPTQFKTPLVNFFYSGLTGFKPVVSFDHYGNPFGQIRTNLFVQTSIWQLRQFGVTEAADTGGTLRVALLAEPVTDTARPTFYGLNQTGDSTQLRSVRSSFKNDFLSFTIPSLVALEVAAKKLAVPKVTDNELFTALAGPISTKYSTFVSNSQDFAGSDVNSVMDSTFRGRVQSKLTALALPWTITTEQLANRATAVTCAGCHAISIGRELAPSNDVSLAFSINQPDSAFFVWLDERGRLGAGLVERFLPRRFQILSDYLKKWDPNFPPLTLSAPLAAQMSLTDPATSAMAMTSASMTTAATTTTPKRSPLISPAEKFATRDQLRSMPGVDGLPRSAH